MNNIVYSTTLLFGKTIGFLSKIFFPPKLFFLQILLMEGISTARNKSRFASFGKKSRISPKTTLIKPEFVHIGENCHFSSYITIEATHVADRLPEIIIGNMCSFGEFTHITCANKIEIGDGTLTGRFVLITDNAHGISSIEEAMKIPLNRKVYSKGNVSIGENVWIGDKVTILPGVKIGKNSIIGANSVVLSDIPSSVVAAGCPAKIVKHLTSK